MKNNCSSVLTYLKVLQIAKTIGEVNELNDMIFKIISAKLEVKIHKSYH